MQEFRNCARPAPGSPNAMLSATLPSIIPGVWATSTSYRRQLVASMACRSTPSTSTLVPGGGDETQQHGECGRFAASGPADQGQQLTRPEPEAQLGQRIPASARIANADPLETNLRAP